MTEYLNTHNASLLLSAANKSHYPQDDLPEIALAGRSNVGKSSFINTLLGRKNLARTSSKPGKTQLMINCVLSMCLVTAMPKFLNQNAPNGAR